MREAVLLKVYLFQGPAGECTKAIVGVRKPNSCEQPGDKNAPAKEHALLERHLSGICFLQKPRSEDDIRQTVEYRCQESVNLLPIMLTVGVERNGDIGAGSQGVGH